MFETIKSRSRSDALEASDAPKYKILSGSAIKMIAVISMAVDHTSKTVLRDCKELFEPHCRGLLPHT